MSPDRAQHFTSDSVSLSCEGNSTEWRVKKSSTEDRYWSDCSSYWGTMTGSTCKLESYWPSEAVYWCESESGEFSNAVNISIQGRISLHFVVFSCEAADSVNWKGSWTVRHIKIKRQKKAKHVFSHHSTLTHSQAPRPADLWLNFVFSVCLTDREMILLSPARPVTEGDSVRLSCKLKSQRFSSTVFFYHNEKLIQNDSRWELNISAVSKSDEGFYKCRHSGQESAQSWMSVQGE